MSISSAFSGALSGLQAFGKASEIIAANIANATTPGYGKRAVVLASSTVAPGVGVAGISRLADPVVLAARRTAEAQFAGSEQVAGFYAGFMQNVGTADDPTSLSGRIATFEAKLIEAASFPDAPARLNSVAQAAVELADAFNRAGNGISDARSAADQSIDRQVIRLNVVLSEVDLLNTQITTAQSRGVDTGGLFDQRQLLIDEINVMVPVREVARPNGQVALFTEAGAILLDGKPAELEFTAVNTVTPFQSLAGGTLSGLTMNGMAIQTSGQTSPLRGGTLLAQFEIRDQAALAAQTQLDSVARDLITRFQDPAVDATLAPGDPGLFTDAGAAFDPINEAGIASRITINALVDPIQSPETWRLRSGLGAVAPGPVGDGSLLNAMRDALSDVRSVASGDLGPGAQTSSGLMSKLSSWAGAANFNTEQRLSFLSASYNEMVEQELSTGVDTDAELQNLLVVEKAYAANARVLATVDEMMELILGLG
ncbi:flagellar hook-associated protein FlgK [Aestuariivita sp.]|jgi:flagellar hook-associated protein 1 FlgK|uniref:flagellar hook-associated protein FlgK n=1 Tax=Aestuariivita sp. TaxID=1872407 RepID=UPI00216B7EE0|nr:flagellar hook-associated protein FlgK [Aestuariivita sp.]MCE8007052.1 flagellar hook-associated protein FlgK [Aestuariivita sp.]